MAGPGSTGGPGAPRRDGTRRDGADGAGREPSAEQVEAAREAGRRSLLFSLLLLCALVAARLPFPWSAVGTAFTAGALVVGGLALASAWSARRRLTVAVMGGGLVLGLFLLLTQAAQLALWPLQDDLRACTAAAATAEARAACERELTDRMTTWTESLGGLAGA